jgi:hypothetical protein
LDKRKERKGSGINQYNKENAENTPVNNQQNIPSRQQTADLLGIGVSKVSIANENAEWQSSPSVVLETVCITHDFLNAELAKYQTWELFNEFIKQLFESQAEYRNTKSKGVGQITILKFLGKNWKQWMIKGDLL